MEKAEFMKLLGHAAVAVAVVFATFSAAQEAPLSGDEFASLTTGRTFYFSRNGQSYGAEQYLPGRQVIWAFTGDDCRKGFWYPEGQDICFVYEDNPEPQCWAFRANTGGLRAEFRGDTENAPLIAKRSSPEPMACFGPDVGV
ncbi:MAG: hypothetical protein WBH04_03130 [Albidovulum sp.]